MSLGILLDSFSGLWAVMAVTTMSQRKLDEDQQGEGDRFQHCERWKPRPVRWYGALVFVRLVVGKGIAG